MERATAVSQLDDEHGFKGIAQLVNHGNWKNHENYPLTFYDYWMDCTVVVPPIIKGDPTTPYPGDLSGYIYEKCSLQKGRHKCEHVTEHVQAAC